MRWKVASDLRFRAAISEPCDLAPSTRKSLAIAIVRFWCAKSLEEGFGVGFGGLVGGSFRMENEAKGEAGGEGEVWGGDRRRVNAHAFVKTTF